MARCDVWLIKLRDIVDYNTLIIIYKSIIQPHFDYCSQVWGCLGKVLSDKLQRLQNRAFRIISREGYETRSKDILNKAGFFDLETRREQQLAVVIYKIKHKICYQITYKIFLLTLSKSIIITRDKENIITHCQCQTLMLWKNHLATEVRKLGIVFHLNWSHKKVYQFLRVR